jgi:hypothetical protein
MPLPERDAVPSAPRYAAVYAAALYAAATLVLGYEALLGRFLVTTHSDQYIAGFAFREFAAASLRAGEGFPLWNPYLQGGMPYVAAMHGDIFYPTFLLRLALPTDVAMTWGFVLHVFLAGMFTYGFLRSFGVGFAGALVGGLVYLMSGPVAGLVSPGHDGKLFVQALLPLGLWMLVLGIRRGVPWSWGVLGLTIGLAVLSPHPQLLQYMLLTSGAFALWLAFSSWGGEPLPRSLAVRRLGYSAGSVLLGGLMGAVQYLPVREYVAWSPRAGGKGWDHAVSYSMPLEELVSTYLPQFSGLLDSYWGRNGIHFHSEYFGAAALVLAIAGLWWADRNGGRSAVWFWAGVFIVSLLWTLGGSTPFYRLVYEIVPGTKFFRAPSTMMYVPMFSVAVFAAFGTERLLAGQLTRRYGIIWLAIAGLIAAIASFGGLTNLALGVAMPGRDDLVYANESATIFGAWRSFAFVGMVVAVALLVGARRLAPRMGALALLAVLTVDYWSVLRHYWQFVSGASQVYASDPAIEAIRSDLEPGRVYSAQLSADAAYRDPFLNGDALMVHRIRHAAGYHGNELGRYQELAGAGQGYLPLIVHPGLRVMLNLRYLYTNAGADEPLDPRDPATVIGNVVPGIEHVVGPVRNAAGSPIHLYRFAEPAPAAWVASGMVKAPDDAVLGTIYDRRFAPELLRQVALFAPEAPVTAAAELTGLPPASTIAAAVTEHAPGRIRVTLDQSPPPGSALVVSENYYPGWRASAGGSELPIGRANYTLIGVELTPGAREILLEFSSSPYRTGQIITLLALLISGVLIAGGWALERRGRASV